MILARIPRKIHQSALLIESGAIVIPGIHIHIDTSKDKLQIHTTGSPDRLPGPVNPMA
ncbi:MAG: hypothetical protein Q7R57_01505 [Dehalococcoidales bacterium]|nr:hypothetical protein [Dehalococcoidales bacterium]